VKGLKPDTPYTYVFRIKNVKSDTGRFRTAPKATTAKTIKFAFSGDADAQPLNPGGKPFWNNFEVYGRMAAEKNAFNINLGDTIYSDTEVGATNANGVFVPGTPAATTVKTKGQKYRMNLDLKNLQKVRAQASMYNQWDDHEFINDFAKADRGDAIYRAGAKAFTNYMPVTRNKDGGIYRTMRWGKNLELFFLDERSFRSGLADAKEAGGGPCENPQTGKRDPAPTLPKDRRDFFAILVKPLEAPVAPACLAAIADPKRTFLGAKQHAQFLKDVKASDARFKVIVNETPIQLDYTLPYDFWEAYTAERTQLLNELRTVKNVVWIATDHHGALVSPVRYSTFPEEGGTKDTGMMEFAAGPVATRNYAQEFDEATGGNGFGLLARDAFFKPAPPNGLGLPCAVVDKFNYGQITVTSSKLTVAYKGDDGKPLREKEGKTCGPFTVSAK
jgi:alkaline phosphatase D